jgi:hypothetical protein
LDWVEKSLSYLLLAQEEEGGLDDVGMDVEVQENVEIRGKLISSVSRGYCKREGYD